MADNPYGVTIFSSGAGVQADFPNAIAGATTLGLSWLRFAKSWYDIENPQGTYNWAGLDDAVSRCNAAGINIAFPLNNAPSWALTYRGGVLADSPWGYYALDEASGTTATDASGNGHTGTLHGTITLGQASPFPDSAAMHFDGSTGYISLPTTGLPSGASAFSLEAWVIFAALPNIYTTIVSLGTVAGNQEVGLYCTNSNTLSVDLHGVASVANGSAISINTWYHVAATYDGSTLRLYVNGIQVNSAAVGATNLTYGTAAIGRDVAVNSYLTGTATQVAIYPSTISPSRVSAHYTNGLAFQTNQSQKVDTSPQYAPNPTLMAGFASAVASRYNGGAHGLINAIEVGNEDFNIIWTPTPYLGIHNSPYTEYNALSGVAFNIQPGRDPHFFVPCLSACSPAIRAASPSTLVGLAAILWYIRPNIGDFLRGLYAELSSASTYFDYANVHFYSGTPSPKAAFSYGANFAQTWQDMQRAMAENGSKKPIWVTEFGWQTNANPLGFRDPANNVTLAQQSTYYQQLFDSARASGIVQKVFFYTLDYTNSDGMSLVQGSGPWTTLPAFSMLASYIKQYPTWPAAPQLLPVADASNISEEDVNQVGRVLQRPTYSVETGKYALLGSAWTNTASLGAYVGSISRGSTPAGSVSIDTSDQAPSNCNTPTTDHLTANGFRVSTTSTGAATTVVTGGNYTIQY